MNIKEKKALLKTLDELPTRLVLIVDMTSMEFIL